MRGSYLAHDRYDLQHAVKELAIEMKGPTYQGCTRLKRVERYLAGAPRCVQRYRRQSNIPELREDFDSDWTGDRSSRKQEHSLHCPTPRRECDQDSGQCNERPITF